MLVPLCARCKKVPPEGGRKRCKKCLAYVRDSVRKAEKRRKDRGYTLGKIGRPRKLREMVAGAIGL